MTLSTAPDPRPLPTSRHLRQEVSTEAQTVLAMQQCNAISPVLLHLGCCRTMRRTEEAEPLRAAGAAHVSADAKPVVFFVPGYMGSRLVIDGVVAYDMEVRRLIAGGCVHFATFKALMRQGTQELAKVYCRGLMLDDRQNCTVIARMVEPQNAVTAAGPAMLCGQWQPQLLDKTLGHLQGSIR